MMVLVCARDRCEKKTWVLFVKSASQGRIPVAVNVILITNLFILIYFRKLAR